MGGCFIVYYSVMFMACCSDLEINCISKDVLGCIVIELYNTFKSVRAWCDFAKQNLFILGHCRFHARWLAIVYETGMVSGNLSEFVVQKICNFTKRTNNLKVGCVCIHMESLERLHLTSRKNVTMVQRFHKQFNFSYKIHGPPIKRVLILNTWWMVTGK